MDEEEALALVVQKRERMTELQTRSVDAKKKKLNDAIAVLRDICEGHGYSNCPLFKVICYGSTYYCDFPINWADID